MQRGFSLTEMTLVMTIIAILGTLAVASYEHIVLRSRRSDAMTALVRLQLQQERWRSTHDTYAGTAELGLPNSPPSPYFDWTVESASSVRYTLKASARGRQANDRQSGVRCDVLTIDQSGDRQPETCWR